MIKGKGKVEVRQNEIQRKRKMADLKIENSNGIMADNVVLKKGLLINKGYCAPVSHMREGRGCHSRKL